MNKKDQEYILFDFIPGYAKKINWLFPRNNIDGLFPAFYILYSYKHKLPISFGDNGLTGYTPGTDPLQDKLFDASILYFGRSQSHFTNLNNLLRHIKSLKRVLFDEIYPRLLDETLCSTSLVSGSQMQPNARIATTIANIIKEHHCNTVLGAFSGIGVYALECDGIKYTGLEPYAPANLIAEVLCEAHGIKNAEFICQNPIEEWTKKQYDAVIGNLPVDADFFNVYRADHFLHKFNIQQQAFIEKLLSKKTATKMAAVLVHFEFAHYCDYDQTRKFICGKGMLESVIALPENIFKEAQVPTYLLILDMEGGHSSATFYDATGSLRRQAVYSHTIRANRFDMRECVMEQEKITVDYETIGKASWSFNPALYLQNAECPKGHELIRLGDLADIPPIKLVKGERYIDADTLSEHFKHVFQQITPGAASEEATLIEGPSIILGLTRGTRDDIQNIRCGICTEAGTYSVEFFLSVLKPKPDKILPEYLALVLLSDPSFADYYKSIQEYWTDNVRPAHLLERRIPVLTDLAQQKKAVTEAQRRAGMAEISYHIVLAGTGKKIQSHRRLLSKYGCCIFATTEKVSGPDGLESILSCSQDKHTPVSKKIDAVIFASDIPFCDKNDVDPFSGLDAILDLRLNPENKNIPFYCLSEYTKDEIIDKAPISVRRMSLLDDGHFFQPNKNGTIPETLASAARQELDRLSSPESHVRARHNEAFIAAEWIDSHYEEKEIHSSETISDCLLAAELGMETKKTLSDLRNVAHRIIEILKECHAVPAIDNGAIPHLLYDREYEDKKKGKTYFQNIPIMKKSLASSLISLIDIGNDGTHGFSNGSSNLAGAMLQTLLEFITWFYENRDEFARILTGYWYIDSEFEQEWTETEGTVEMKIVHGKPVWFCGDVQLFVDKHSSISDGDAVLIKKRRPNTFENRLPELKFAAFPKSKKNPEGYLLKESIK